MRRWSRSNNSLRCRVAPSCTRSCMCWSRCRRLARRGSPPPSGNRTCLARRPRRRYRECSRIRPSPRCKRRKPPVRRRMPRPSCRSCRCSTRARSNPHCTRNAARLHTTGRIHRSPCCTLAGQGSPSRARSGDPLRRARPRPARPSPIRRSHRVPTRETCRSPCRRRLHRPSAETNRPWRWRRTRTRRRRLRRVVRTGPVTP